MNQPRLFANVPQHAHHATRHMARACMALHAWLAESFPDATVVVFRPTTTGCQRWVAEGQVLTFDGAVHDVPFADLCAYAAMWEVIADPLLFLWNPRILAPLTQVWRSRPDELSLWSPCGCVDEVEDHLPEAVMELPPLDPYFTQRDLLCVESAEAIHELCRFAGMASPIQGHTP